jgi:ABC-2 type transport system ATP-binding protein
MKQKLALACTLVHSPDLIFLDEPTTGVDPVSRRDFWKILSGLQKRGITVVLTTPYMDEAERCNRIALMHNGRIMACEKPPDLKRKFDGVVIELICTNIHETYKLLRKELPFTDIQALGDRLNIVSDRNETDTIAKILQVAGIEPMSLKTVEPSLENVFINLIKHDMQAPLSRP